MRVDQPKNGHEEIRFLIDESLNGTIEQHEEILLADHLSTCLECREYCAEIDCVVAALGGFAFESTPGLHAQVHRSMQQQLQKMEADRSQRHRELLTSGAAFVLSFLGSFLLWQPSDSLAGFWIVPSLLAALLIPIVPTLLMKAQSSKGFAL
jgi:hypothetical protein